MFLGFLQILSTIGHKSCAFIYKIYQMKNLLKIIVLLVASISIMNRGNSQDSQKDKKAANEAAVKNMIDSQDFVFVPRSLIPMSGGSRQLDQSDYLRISKDSIVSYLPYFGRAFTAPVNSSDAGFEFTSTKFEYSKKENKKGGWDILIKLKDQMYVRELSFVIFDNGSASLNITSLNRDPISYDGYIRSRKDKK